MDMTPFTFEDNSRHGWGGKNYVNAKEDKSEHGGHDRDDIHGGEDQSNKSHDKARQDDSEDDERYVESIYNEHGDGEDVDCRQDDGDENIYNRKTKSINNGQLTARLSLVCLSPKRHFRRLLGFLPVNDILSRNRPANICTNCCGV